MRPAPSVRRADNPDQDRQLHAYLARNLGSLTRLPDDPEDAGRATIGTVGKAAENSGEAR